MRIRRRTRKRLFVGVIVLLALMMVYSGYQIIMTAFFRETPEEDPNVVSKTITRDGVDYFPRQDITVFLLMGIDQFGKVEASNSYNNHGAADMAVLLIFDETNEICNVLQLNRDTMLEMPVIGIGGKPAGSYFGQLALSHTYGSGLKDSCENTVQAVSDLLYGLNIDYYVAMNMDAISILNDAVGGVMVTVEEDFSQIDPTIGMGEVTLRGEQALNFVRTRKDVGDQLNVTRMDRHKEYMDSFLEAFRQKTWSDSGFIRSAYEDVADYLVSNCPLNAISKLAERYEDYELGETVTPQGRNELGKKYFEFYVDEEDLDRLILELFYLPKE